jgi:hypothetical protein
MKFNKSNILFIILTSLIIFFPKRDFAQKPTSYINFFPKSDLAPKPTSYKMDFIRACSDSSEKGKNILTIFKVTPKISDFKLFISMRVFYQLENGKEILSILKQDEDNIKIIIYGKDIQQKNKFLYDFIKDKVQLENENDDVYFLAFIFDNITKEKVENMSMTYGLWESNNTEIRHEIKYDFIVEKVDNLYFQNISKP